MVNQKSLLSQIAKALNLIYISDIFQHINAALFETIILQIPESSYELWEWQDAVNYITGFQGDKISNITQAKAFLINQVKVSEELQEHIETPTPHATYQMQH